MLNNLYKKLESCLVGYTIKMYNNIIYVYANNKEVQIYEKDNQLDVYLFENNKCIEGELFDNKLIVYYHIKSFLL